MDFFEAYLNYDKPGYYQWPDFIGDYESVSYDHYEKEIQRFRFLRENVSELLQLSIENLRVELDNLPKNGPDLNSKSELFHRILFLTDLAFKREFFNALPQHLKIDFYFRYQDGLFREGILEIIISELEDSSVDTYVPDWIGNNDINFQLFHDEYPNAEELIDYFDFFSFGDTTLKEWLDNWKHSFLIKIVPKIEIIKPIRITNTFDPNVYTLIKRQPELLKTMDWRLFEEMLADILKRFKYEVELTRATKDGGIDIIAVKRDFDFGEHKYILQAKRYASAVEVSPVRELLFLHDHHKASKSCLATTATFTKGAWELADQYKWQLELKDQQGIMSWIDEILRNKA